MRNFRAKLLFILAAAGFCVALYAYTVEVELSRDKFYQPACKLSIGSCVTVFTSEYARPLSLWGLVDKGSQLDVSLSVAGLLNYGLFMLYPIFGRYIAQREAVMLVLSGASIVFSIYLLYVLKFILGEFCIVCTSFHLVNFSMFFFVALPDFRDPRIFRIKESSD